MENHHGCAHCLTDDQFKPLLIKSIITILFAALLMLAEWFSWLPAISQINGRIVAGIIGLIALFFMLWTGKYFYINAWSAFKKHSATMDTLIAVGTLAAWIYSSIIILFFNLFPSQHIYYEAVLMIIGLINLGAALELRARGKTSEAIKNLLNLKPKIAHYIDQNGNEKDITVDEVHKDTILRVKPGEQIPVDGIITQGSSRISEAMITGEAMPVNKKVGDLVTGGTINESGSFLFKATRVGAETTLAQIIQLVQSAQNTKPPISRLVDTISSYFVPIVLIIAVITALFWFNMHYPANFILTTAMTVLIIACPCALGLATPISVIAGMGKAAQNGILIRNGDALEKASKISVIVLDKTGTVTKGHPEVVAIEPIHISNDNLLQIAASIEIHSEHPIAKAIVKFTKEKNLALLNIENFSAHSGYGVSAKLNNHKILIGHSKFLQENNIIIPDTCKNKALALAKKAATPIYVAQNNECLGIIAVADPIKKDSKLAVSALQKKISTCY